MLALTLPSLDRFFVFFGVSYLYVFFEGAHIEVRLIAATTAHETSILNSLVLNR